MSYKPVGLIYERRLSLKNSIEIVFDHNIYKAFWNNERPYKTKTGYRCIQHRSRLIFVATPKTLQSNGRKSLSNHTQALRVMCSCNIF